jgi:translation initiation factor IF-3
MELVNSSIMTTKEALTKAAELGLDLIEVAMPY